MVYQRTAARVVTFWALALAVLPVASGCGGSSGGAGDRVDAGRDVATPVIETGVPDNPVAVLDAAAPGIEAGVSDKPVAVLDVAAPVMEAGVPDKPVAVLDVAVEVPAIVDAAPDQGPDVVSGDAGALGLTKAPAATALASATLARAVWKTFTAGDKVIALYSDKDFGVIDMRDPKNPQTYGPYTTAGKVLAVDFDEQRSLLFGVDATGVIFAASMPVAASVNVVASATVPSFTGALAIARVANRLYVLNGTALRPVLMTLQGTLPTALTAEAELALAQPANFLGGGASLLYLGYADGLVESWAVDLVSGVPSKAGTFNGGGTLVSLLPKASKLMLLVNGIGLRVLDFAVAVSPVEIATLADLADATDARLIDRTLVVALSRGLVAAIDLSNYAAPRAITSNPGTLPSFIALVAGNVVLGSGSAAQVLGVPPVISSGLPSVVQNSVPLNGIIPVTFSKLISAASLAGVSLSCGGSAVAGAAALSPDGKTVLFRPTAALPANASCALSLTGVTDPTGLTLAAAATTYSFGTAASAPAQANNAKSKFAHKVDGKFTDFASGDGGLAGEWSDVQPMRGMYTYFYADFDGQYLWILNDWYKSEEKIDPDCYNLFSFGLGPNRWTIRAYGDQHVEAYKDGVLVDPKTGGVEGASGFAASPNLSNPHTIWELKIPSVGGEFSSQLSDPTSDSHCGNLAAEPSAGGGLMGNGMTIGMTAVPAPTIATLTAPADAATNVSVTPVLAWTDSNQPNQFVWYQVQLATSSSFTSGIVIGGSYTQTWSPPSGALAGNTQYYWRVLSYSLGGWITSSMSSFTTGPKPLAGSYTLDAIVSGQGTVTSVPTGIACTGSCTATFSATTSVTLTATPATGWQFAGWYGSCAGLTGPATVTMVDNLQCVALFTQIPTTGFVAVAVSGVGGSVSSAPAGITACASSSGTCTASFPLNSTVVLTATPQAGYTFSGWYGSCTGTATGTLTVSSTYVYCVATFTSACGALGQACCSTAPACTTGLACTGGSCQSTSTGAPTTLAANEVGFYMAVDATNVYWSSLVGTIKKVPLNGGTVVTLASGQSSPYKLVVDATNVYWVNYGTGANDGAVMSVPIAGGTPTQLAGAQGSPVGIAVDGSYVYWTTRIGGTLMKVPVGGGTATQLASGEMLINDVTVDSTSAYFTNWFSNTVKKVGLAGGTATTLASGQSVPWSLVVDATNVYWLNKGSGSGASANGSVMKVGLSGGTPVALVASAGTPQFIAADGSNVYFTDGLSPGSLFKVPVDGGATTKVATGTGYLFGVAVDGTSVYWTGSGVFKSAK